MMHPLRLLCVLAHPDDETLGTGGILARYPNEGIETFLVTATRGEKGRYNLGERHPGPKALGAIREGELRRAEDILRISEVNILDYPDGGLDKAEPEAFGRSSAIFVGSGPM
jgi:LmbE family N-acetylglucosaminyl deacetylase